MRLALREAERALEHGDVPIGAVVVHDGEVIARGRNERELRQDPTAHAEMLALREAAREARQLAAARHRALRDARAVRDVRRRDRAGARAARRLRRATTRRPARPAACSTCSPSRASTTGRSVAGGLLARGVRRAAATRSSRRRGADSDTRYPLGSPWRGGRAVECGGLENRYGRVPSIEGSNPSPSVAMRPGTTEGPAGAGPSVRLVSRGAARCC